MLFIVLGKKVIIQKGLDTQESGLNIIATPQDLRYSPNTLSKKNRGVQLKILDENGNGVKAVEVGQFIY